MQRFSSRRAVAAGALSAALVAVVVISGSQNRAPQPVQPVAPPTAAAQEEPFQFLLQSSQGKLEVSLLAQGAWEPIAQYDVTLEDLPAVDRQYLQTGIALRDSEELQRALEDYLPSS